MGLLILFFLVSIIFSFLCSIWEAALLSIPPSTVEVLHQKGTTSGLRLKRFKENIDRPLAAILTLNTIAHTVGAIGVGAQAAKVWDEGGLMATLVVPIIMTLAILILSEIIPKTIGANSWKRLIPFTVNSVNFIIYALYPLVWLSQLITKAMKKDKEKSVLSRSDFTAMAEIGAREGVFHPGESKIIRNLLRFNTIRTKDVMTPRTVVIAADQDIPIIEFHEQNPNLRFSRIPIFESSKDNITGFFLKDDLLLEIIQQRGKAPLQQIRRDIMVVNEQMPIPELFNRLVEDREQIALVVDEFGGMAGLVTMEDVIETLLGLEIMDELDNIEDMQSLARKNWEKRAKSLGILPTTATEQNAAPQKTASKRDPETPADN
jgi:CBS domain containing-hemolysin-like protein